MSAKPKLRWWWPHGAVEVDEIKAEVDQMYQAGFGGAEINDVHRGVKVAIDPVGHGWATEPWIEAVQAASDHSLPLGFQIDFALGPSYPAAVPTLTPDDAGAEKEVVGGQVVVTNGATYTGPIPQPAKAAGNRVNNKTLLAVHAWRMNAASTPTAVPVVLDLDTRVDLTSKVENGNVTFTPPDKGTWLIISYHMRGTGQVAEAGPHNAEDGAVIDHFSMAGITASTDFWDQNILSPTFKSVLKGIGGSFFEDSIELEYETLWTPGLRCEFKRRRGYDLFRYLPAVVQAKQKNAYKFADEEVTRGVINDFWDTLSELYIENHADHMMSWSKSLGMKFRAQVYGLPTDAMSASAAISIPEGESLGFKNMGDYRSLAGAANMMGLNLISNEACAFAGAAYSVTWELGKSDRIGRAWEMMSADEESCSAQDFEPHLHQRQQPSSASRLLLPKRRDREMARQRGIHSVQRQHGLLGILGPPDPAVEPCHRYHGLYLEDAVYPAAGNPAARRRLFRAKGLYRGRI